MAYDIVSDFGFGAPFGFVDSGTDIGGLIQGFHDGCTAFGLMGRFYPFTGLMKKTKIGRQMLVAKPGDKTGIGTLMTFRDKLLAERIADIEQGKTPRLDLLQTFLEARTPEGQPLETDYVKAEILLVLLAVSFQYLAYKMSMTDRFRALIQLERPSKLSSITFLRTQTAIKRWWPK